MYCGVNAMSVMSMIPRLCLLFLGSCFICSLCYDNRSESGWTKQKAWSIRYRKKEEDERYASLTPAQKQAAKEWEIEKEFIRERIQN